MIPVGSAGSDAAVFVPAEPIGEGDAQARVQMRTLSDGRLALLAYTSLPLLVAGCGSDQGWMGIPQAWVESLRVQVGAEGIAYDVALPPQSRVNREGLA
ncbi:SseB family protein [Rhodococcus sp. D2-41]|uniref:SseB protein N-terminal domain-containing protein n=1 Tax=Speluncibacter jeojiensis TaxID=2710754 RepID=A0A9X4RF00_9ACTN|nr:SAV_915 family protein [Rhodococcus sp. D2-41]MDG3009193.1 SseB family protein [Rhodococcus sp. D2-41]MDG3016133.1 hypothetical protein [Corynebacteriales bacterium D3-21]